MITCPNCGAENALGRVFCMNCGGKLELSNMNQEDIKDLQGGWFARNRKVIAAVAGGIILLVLLVALWPSKGLLGEEGSNSEAMWMRANLSRIERIREKQYMPLMLTEKRFNGYFANNGANELGFTSVSGEIGDDCFTVKAVKQFVSFRIKGYGFDIGLSILLKYGVADGVASLRYGAIGHIPLPGSLSKLPELILTAMIKGSKEYEAVKLTKRVELSSGQLNLRLEK